MIRPKKKAISKEKISLSCKTAFYEMSFEKTINERSEDKTVVTIKTLNEVSQSEFVHILKDIFEHSPWIPEKSWKYKPFSSLEDLHKKMVQVVEDAQYEEKLLLLQAHPNLGARIEMSSSSVDEQAGAGLNQLTLKEYEEFSDLNTQYMEKFHFPFIMAVKNRTKEEIYAAMQARAANSLSVEFETAFLEIYKISLFRLKDLIGKEIVS